MQTMYDGANGSPSNKLLNLINSSATSITLDSASNLPAAPNIATIGDSATAEVILYTGKSGSTLTGVTRGFGGTTAQSWAANTPVYRAFTKYDYDAIKLNINTIGDATSTNLLINGGFDVWQRGTSFSAQVYTADRWRVLYDGAGATRAITQQAFTVGQTEVPNNPTYYLRFNQSVAGSGAMYNVFYQPIEDVTKLSGKTVTLSFYAKADASRNLVSQFQQNFGPGGSATAYMGDTTHAITTSWQLFTHTQTIPSVSGKTICENNYTGLYFYVPNNTTFTIEIANVQLNYGSVALPFVPRSFADELALCQRYYEKTYDLAVVPGTVNNATGLWFTNVLGVTTANAAEWPFGKHPVFKVRKRITPTVTLYTDEGTAGQWAIGGAYMACFVWANESGCSIVNGTGGSVTPSAGKAYGHWTADAEL